MGKKGVTQGYKTWKYQAGVQCGFVRIQGSFSLQHTILPGRLKNLIFSLYLIPRKRVAKFPFDQTIVKKINYTLSCRWKYT